MILTMMRDLPRGSRLQSRTFGMREAVEPDSEIDWYLERREWGSSERMLMAAQLNMLGDLRKFIPQWKNGKGPDHEPVGPPEWRGIKPQSEEEQRPASIEDAMRVFGWSG